MLRLVQGLLALCGRPECDRETSLEVARCLGQVGPVDFRCIALSPNNNHGELVMETFPRLPLLGHHRHLPRLEIVQNFRVAFLC